MKSRIFQTIWLAVSPTQEDSRETIILLQRQQQLCKRMMITTNCPWIFLAETKSLLHWQPSVEPVALRNCCNQPWTWLVKPRRSHPNSRRKSSPLTYGCKRQIVRPWSWRIMPWKRTCCVHISHPWLYCRGRCYRSTRQRGVAAPSRSTPATHNNEGRQTRLQQAAALKKETMGALNLGKS